VDGYRRSWNAAPADARRFYGEDPPAVAEPPPGAGQGARQPGAAKVMATVAVAVGAFCPGSWAGGARAVRWRCGTRAGFGGRFARPAALSRKACDRTWRIAFRQRPGAARRLIPHRGDADRRGHGAWRARAGNPRRRAGGSDRQRQLRNPGAAQYGGELSTGGRGCAGASAG
jgi:hypothetical protein